MLGFCGSTTGISTCSGAGCRGSARGFACVVGFGDDGNIFNARTTMVNRIAPIAMSVSIGGTKLGIRPRSFIKKVRMSRMTRDQECPSTVGKIEGVESPIMGDVEEVEPSTSHVRSEYSGSPMSFESIHCRDCATSAHVIGGVTTADRYRITEVPCSSSGGPPRYPSPHELSVVAGAAKLFSCRVGAAGATVALALLEPGTD